jgi:biopolymer transport protein ExbD
MKLSSAPLNKARIEIIPMIDTMFFLLVFFMIATLTMTTLEGMPLNLPKPTESSSADDPPKKVTLAISKSGAMFYNEEKITIHELEARLRTLLYDGKEPLVVIKADEEASHGRVIEVMDSIRNVGIVNISISRKAA